MSNNNNEESEIADELTHHTNRVKKLISQSVSELKTPKRFVKEGVLKFSKSTSDSPTERYAFLFHNAILLTTKQKKGYKLNLSVGIKRDLVVENLEDPKQFTLNIPAKNITLLFEGEDEEQGQEWFEKVSKAVAGDYDLDVVDVKFKEVDGEQVWDVRAGLNNVQRRIIEELEEKLNQEDLTDYQKSYLEDDCLCRYLRARNWDVNKAFKMLMNTLKWREETHPEAITLEEIEADAEAGHTYISTGRDKRGRPIVYMRPGRGSYTKEARAQKVKYMTWVLENSAKTMRTKYTGIEKMSWIIDFEGAKFDNKTDNIKLSKDTIGVMQDHYPERLGMAFLLNAPKLFFLLWKIVSKVVDPVTNQKVQILKKEDWPNIFYFNDKDQVEEMYGGTLDYVYDFSEWKQIYFPQDEE